MTAAGQDAFGMELDALHRKLVVPDAHDGAVLRQRGDDQALRHRPGLDDERVVAGRLEALVQAPVDALPVVRYLRRLAVDGLATHYVRPESLPDRLVAEADAEDGDPIRGLLDELYGDAGLLRRARTRRDDYPVRVELEGLFGCDLVVAPDQDLGPELTQILDQVVREGVVVVYNEDPHSSGDFSR